MVLFWSCSANCIGWPNPAFTRNAPLKCIAKLLKLSMQNKHFFDMFQIYFGFKILTKR